MLFDIDWIHIKGGVWDSCFFTETIVLPCFSIESSCNKIEFWLFRDSYTSELLLNFEEEWVRIMEL